MTKGTLRIVEGDVTNPQRENENEKVLIPHVCNSSRAWGAGFVLALSKKDKTPEICYKKMFPVNSSIDEHTSMLGEVSYASFCGGSYICYERTGNNLVECIGDMVVANMIAQDGFIGQSDYNIPLRYVALVECMKKVALWIKNRPNSEKYVIHAPKFGSELAGGDFRFILELVREIWLEKGIDVVIYEFKK